MIVLGPVSFFLIAFIFFTFMTWDYPLISPDEARYAESAREMLVYNNWIIPYLDGFPRFAKPILVYWLQAFSMSFFGVNEFAVRLPSLIAGSALVSLAFLFGSICEIGVLSAVITMTSAAIFITAKLAITDMLLCFFISAALVFFYFAFEQINFKKEKNTHNDSGFSIWMVLSFMMMGFGFLTKGPVALILPLLIILIFVILQTDFKSFLQEFFLEISIGLLLILVINLPWYVLVHIFTNGAFTKEFFFADNFARFLTTKTAHSGAIWYYLPVVFGGVFPWSFFILQSFFATDISNSLTLQSEKKRQKQIFLFSIIWIVTVFIFFSISKTKLPTYILPVFLPIAFLIANWWQQRFQVTKSHNSKNLGLFWGLACFLFILVSAYLLYLFKFQVLLSAIDANSFFLAITIIFLVYLSCLSIALTSVFSNAKLSFTFVVIGTIITFLVFTNMILKPFVQYRDAGSKEFVKSLPQDAELKTLILHPSRFSFYGERIINKITPKDLEHFIKSSQNPYLALNTKDYTRLEKRAIKDSFSFDQLGGNKIFTYVVLKADPTKTI